MKHAIWILLLAAPALAAPPAVTCKHVPGASALLTKGSTVLVGEVHGTNEIPQAFGELVCIAVKAGVPVRIGLEMQPPELSAVEKFLDSGDRSELMKATPFTRKRQDGRTSQAMVTLLERLRALRSAGGKIHLSLFDAQPGDPSLRPLLMAQTLRATRAEDKNDLLLVLVGEDQAALQPKTMATLLQQRKIKLVSLHATHAEGSAWTCQGNDCGEHKVAGDPPAKPLSVQLDAKLGTYSGTYYVGPITASPPAAAH